MSKKKSKNFWKVIEDYLIITLGLLCYTVGWTIFVFPNEMVGGGVSGISAIIQYATNGAIPVAYSFFFINLILLLIGLKVLGKGFGVKTVYAIIIASVFYRILPLIIPQDFITDMVAGVNSKVLCAIMGGALSGLGIGLTFSRGGSTGGTDIIALMVNKYRNISPGRMILLMDIFIVGSSIFLPFEGESLGGRIADIMCGYLLVGACSVTVDLYMSGTKQSVQLFIFSKKYEEIADMISGQMNRGVTVMDGKGWYSKEDEKILLVMVRKTESHALLSQVKHIDKNAFISVGSVMGVYGLGFDTFKEGKKNKKNIKTDK